MTALPLGSFFFTIGFVAFAVLVTLHIGRMRRELDLLTAELRDVQRVTNRLFLEDHERKLRGEK